MKRIIMAGAMVAAATTAAYAECVPATPDEIEAVRHAMQEELLDSESARFSAVCKSTRTLDRKKPITAYCGRVNAKNRYGAYVGFHPFYATLENGGAVQSFAEHTTGDSAFNSFYCFVCEEPEMALQQCFDRTTEIIRGERQPPK